MPLKTTIYKKLNLHSAISNNWKLKNSKYNLKLLTTKAGTLIFNFLQAIHFLSKMDKVQPKNEQLDFIKYIGYTLIYINQQNMLNNCNFINKNLRNNK